MSEIDDARNHAPRHPVMRFMMHVLWPAFLGAIITTGVVFSMVDPLDLAWPGVKFDESEESAYTVGFILFWALFSLACGLTYFLGRTDRRRPPSN